MSSSSSDADLILWLTNVSTQLNRYLSISIFLFGVIGNLLNILVLSQRPLRSNPCAWLFLVSSIANSLSLVAALTSRMLSTWNADLTNTSQILCKLRIFVLFDSLTIAFWLLTLATIDRWLSSSTGVHRRQKSTLRNIQRAAIGIIIFCTLFEAQHIYCFEANLTNTPLKCYTKTVTCAIVSDISFALVTVLIPLLLMFVFGLMIISNVRQTHARLQPVAVTMNGSEGQNATAAASGRHNQQRKKDRHLLIMLFVQILVIIIFTVPLALSKFYTTLTRNIPKSARQNTIENFIFNLFLLLVNVASGLPFYIYTLTGGNVFRKALFHLVKSAGRTVICQYD